jgi:signal transduction histidine kinase
MLLVLHIAIWLDFGSSLSRSLMLAHLGLFFIWQPIWRRDLRLEFRGAVVFLIFTLGFMYWLNWWVLLIWLYLLIGLVGGRMLPNRYSRYAHLLTLLFLVTETLIRCVTAIFVITYLDPGVMRAFELGLFAIPALVMIIPTQPITLRQPGPVDFFRGVTVSLMTGIVALGSLVTMYHMGVDYPVALIQSSLILGAFLLAISWLLSPHGGFGGLHQVWEQSLLNIGTPFEQWLGELTRLDSALEQPLAFQDAAMHALAELPWIEGLHWRINGEEQQLGKKTFFLIRLGSGRLDVTIFTRRAFGPMLMIHCKLLVELVEIFYKAKVREQQLALQAHQQAIYETGARVTHDIKNLLQSLKTMTVALEKDRDPKWKGPERRSGERRGRQLINRQLPLLTQRLELALDKLQAPVETDIKMISFSRWWKDFVTRNSDHGSSFKSELQRDLEVPGEMFDSVVENLLENARQKRTQDYGLQISVLAEEDKNGVSLSVTDNGKPIPAKLVKDLFKQPVVSDIGLGIGLYQAQRQANLVGYEVELVENEAGKVCFQLHSTETNNPLTEAGPP